jgi:predicted nucleic acid-binding protein
LNKRSLVCDTSLLLYLGRVRQVILLQELFAQIYVPEAVVLELDMGRMLRHDTLDPKKWPELEIVAVSTT